MGTLDAAIAHVLRDRRIVKLAPGRKTPAESGPLKVYATVAEVEAAWTLPDGSEGNFNIGWYMDKYIAFDIDVPGGSHTIDGRPEAERLGILNANTYRHLSTSGGIHAVFEKAAGVDFAQSDAAPGINVRSTGGWIVVPGSTLVDIPGKQVGGRYKVLNSARPAPLPDHLRALLKLRGAENRYDEGSYDGEWDCEGSVEWCWRYVREWAPKARKGSRGRTGLEIAHVLGDRAITRDLALEMLREWHETHCDPPNDDTNQMAHVLNSAYSNRQRPFGADCVTQWLEPVDVPRSALIPATKKEEKPRVPFAQRVRKSRVRCAEDIKDIPRVPWLVRGKLVKGAIAGLVSPPGIGKSTLTLQWAAALAIGDGAFTGLHALENAEPRNTLVIGIEDTREIMEARLAAVCLAFGLDFAEIGERVHFYSGLTDGHFALMSRQDRRQGLQITADAAELEQYIKDNDIAAFFADPLVELHDGEENDNGEMRRVMGALRDIAANTNAAGLIVHHTRKPSSASSESYAGDQFAGRGASSINASFRIGMTMFGASEKDAEAHPEAITPLNRGEFIRLDDSKANWSAVSPKAVWFRREQIQLANGDSAAVLRLTPLDASADKSAEFMAEEIAAILTAGQPASIGAVCAALAVRPTYESLSERALRRKVRERLSGSKPVQTSRGTLVFSASGKEGGTVTLS